MWIRPLCLLAATACAFGVPAPVDDIVAGDIHWQHAGQCHLELINLGPTVRATVLPSCDCLRVVGPSNPVVLEASSRSIVKLEYVPSDRKADWIGIFVRIGAATSQIEIPLP
jgi:hypothetical protein